VQNVSRLSFQCIHCGPQAQNSNSRDIRTIEKLYPSQDSLLPNPNFHLTTSRDTLTVSYLAYSQGRFYHHAYLECVEGMILLK
jgi:hypothetical protein